MEKRKPHYDLADVLAVVKLRGANVFTKVALSGAADLGLLPSEAVKVVLGLSASQFYKSMTTNMDHRQWQDVYHAETLAGKQAYVKLTLRDDGAVVIQFKEK